LHGCGDFKHGANNVLSLVWERCPDALRLRPGESLPPKSERVAERGKVQDP
jgi:hypothetical protein